MKKYKLYIPYYHECDQEFYARDTEEAIKVAKKYFIETLNIVCVGNAMLYEGSRFIVEFSC